MNSFVGRAPMARIWLIVFLLGATAAAAQPAPSALTAPPVLTAPVNDFAGVIDAASARDLEALIRRLEGASGDVIVVATVKTFQPWADLPSYTVKMFENGGQGIGQKGKDNGLLIVVAVDDRGVRVEPGYDLEAFITDGFAGEISREVMVPYFRSGDYGQGVLAGATRIAQRIAEGRNVDIGLTPVEPRRTRRNTGIRIPFGFWIVLLIIILNLIGGGGGPRGMRRRNRWISSAGAFGAGWPRGGGGWGSSGGFGGGFGGFGGGRSGGGGGGASW